MRSRRDSTFIKRFIAVPAMAAVSASSASAALPPQLRLVALTGRQAAGTVAGTTYSVLGPGDFDGAPRIGADGALGFAAVLSDGTAGFWVDRGMGLELLAHSGDHAPGTEPGVVFRQRVAEVVLFTPPLLAPGQVVLGNTLAGTGVGFDNDEGIWNLTSSGLSLLVREGDPVPGLAGVRLSTMMIQGIDDSGTAIVHSLLAGAVVDGNDEAVWRVSAQAGFEMIAREGDAAPGAGFGVVFAAPEQPSAFPVVVTNARGDVLFQGNLHGPGTGSANDEALFVRDISGTQLLIREGDPVPGMPGFVFRQGASAGFSASNLSLSVSGRIAIAASVADATHTQHALLTGVVGHLDTAVRSGDVLPGAPGACDLITSAIQNENGDVAFLASTDPGAPFPVLGAWVRSGAGLRAVAVPGQPLTGHTEAGVVQSVRTVHGLSLQGDLLFMADLTLPGGLGSTALVLARAGGEATVLARTGAPIEIAAGDVRTVSQVFVRPRALGGSAQAAFGVKFTDGSGADFVGSAGAAACYANCDASTTAPVLNVNDFICFQARLAAGETYANCDGSTTVPVLNVNDFVCFQSRFAAGCP